MPPSRRRAPGTSEWEGVRLHVVSGKGGTGKTTVAGALALALASGGRRTLLLEVEGRQGIAQLFDTPPLPYEERKVAVAPDGGEVFALAVDAEEALLEYLDLFYHLGRAGRVLKKIGAIEFATTIAPGLRDVLLTGKAYEAAGRRRAGRTEYDAIVLDVMLPRLDGWALLQRLRADQAVALGEGVEEVGRHADGVEVDRRHRAAAQAVVHQQAATVSLPSARRVTTSVPGRHRCPRISQ